ncbi:MAG: Type 1 glutamine amidotransferase-like domain-containing protein [Chloroflexota bacterium]
MAEKAAPTRAAPILLAGSGEFRPPMLDVDRALLALVGSARPRVAIVPTAAGREATVDTWIRDGVRHFGLLGCEAYGVRAIDRRSADGTESVRQIATADVIYLSGGDPGYLVETLRESALWRAITAARARGAILAGSSAGAMAQGAWTMVRPRESGGAWTWSPALKLLRNVAVVPHYDRFKQRGVDATIADAPSGLTIYGIDEDTVILLAGGAARVLGRGGVTVWHRGAESRHEAGEEVPHLTRAL